MVARQQKNNHERCFLKSQHEQTLDGGRCADKMILMCEERGLTRTRRGRGGGGKGESEREGNAEGVSFSMVEQVR